MKAEDGRYTVYVPALRGCISEGDTKEEATANIREAIDLWLEVSDSRYELGDGDEIIEAEV